MLDRHGLARVTSLPRDGYNFSSSIMGNPKGLPKAYFNPASDRRTTSGVFRVADVGSPAADDKKVVPLNAGRIVANCPKSSAGRHDFSFFLRGNGSSKMLGFPITSSSGLSGSGRLH